MPLAIFLRKIFKIDMGWSMRSGPDRYTLHVSVGKIGKLVSGSGLRVFRCLSVYFGGRALDGYFVVQIQSPSPPNFSWIQADRYWSRASSVDSSANDCKTSCFYRPVYVSLPADAIGRVDVC